jgi:hypothetical protein
MWSPYYYVLASILVLPGLCQNSTNTSVPAGAYPFSVYTLTAENITAKFIPYGARLTSLLVQDRDGNYQDVVAGYDNATQYLTDTESESRREMPIPTSAFFQLTTASESYLFRPDCGKICKSHQE